MLHSRWWQGVACQAAPIDPGTPGTIIINVPLFPTQSCQHFLGSSSVPKVVGIGTLYGNNGAMSALEGTLHTCTHLMQTKDKMQSECLYTPSLQCQSQPITRLPHALHPSIV